MAAPPIAADRDHPQMIVETDHAEPGPTHRNGERSSPAPRFTEPQPTSPHHRAPPKARGGHQPVAPFGLTWSAPEEDRWETDVLPTASSTRCSRPGTCPSSRTSAWRRWNWGVTWADLTSIAEYGSGSAARSSPVDSLVWPRAHASKACEGATLPWVQIPPPPVTPGIRPVLPVSQERRSKACALSAAGGDSPSRGPLLLSP